jgi:CRP/FNR family transcriptional regulator
MERPQRMTTADWTAEFRALDKLDSEARASLRSSAVRKEIPRGSVLFRPGDACIQFPLVASGSVRVQRMTESGREILLYRVVANETCILTTASLLSAESYAVEGVAETDVVAYVLSAAKFNALMHDSAAFRGLVFEGYSKRLAAMMARLEEIMCTPVSVRLAERLLALMDGAGEVAATQQSLAADLGTAREVVGRLLKSFVASGAVVLRRGGLLVVNPATLRAIASANGD